MQIKNSVVKLLDWLSEEQLALLQGRAKRIDI